MSMMDTKSIKKLVACLGICFLAAVGNVFAQVSFQIVPGVKVGAITARTSEADLKKIYGGKNVRAGDIGIGEGETVPGTIVYPNDPRKRIEIAWKDATAKKSPDFVQFNGDKSLWTIAPGISLGTSLKALEQFNGKGFVLTGFEWDYAGTVIDWNGGKLARKFGKDNKFAILRLSPKTYGNRALQKDLDAVAGDRDFSSKNKSMQKINPAVYQIIVKFP